MRIQLLDPLALNVLLPLQCMLELARAAVHCSLCSRVALQNYIGCLFDYFFKMQCQYVCKISGPFKPENWELYSYVVCRLFFSFAVIRSLFFLSNIM